MPIPTGIKIITYYDQKGVLRAFSFTKKKPIEYKDYG